MSMAKCTIKVNGAQLDIDLKRFKTYMRKPTTIKALRIGRPFSVKTLEGVMHGKAGDFLILGAEGEKYVCDSDIFFEIHEKVRKRGRK
jgi:hypothetical protein